MGAAAGAGRPTGTRAPGPRLIHPNILPYIFFSLAFCLAICASTRVISLGAALSSGASSTHLVRSAFASSYCPFCSRAVARRMRVDLGAQGVEELGANLVAALPQLDGDDAPGHHDDVPEGTRLRDARAVPGAVLRRALVDTSSSARELLSHTV